MEEHVLIDLCLSIDLIIFFSSFEVFVLLLGIKLLTFVLYPLVATLIVKITLNVKKFTLRVNDPPLM